MLHMFYNGYTCVSDVYMLQVFQLFQKYVANVFSRCYKSRSGVAHVAVNPIMHMSVEGVRAASADRDEAGVGHRLAWDMEWARDMERHGTPREGGIRRGRLNASPRLDIRTLAFPLIIR
jgi:hypothetical protein